MEYLGNYRKNIDEAFEKLKQENVLQKILDYDNTVWKPDPTEITDRLGWLHSIQPMREAVKEMASLVQELKEEGFENALLLGMGGSSLAPEVFRKTFGVKPGYLDLHVLDSTDPGTVLEYDEKLDPEKTLYVVSTKSGTTVETLSFMKYFYNRVIEKIGREKAGRHFIAITDPDSGLVKPAGQLGFRKTFLNDPNVGGRYSALTYFGLVPAALVGVDIKQLLDRAQIMADSASSYQSPIENDISASRLGVILGELAAIGRDKLTFMLSPEIEHFGDWVEQLIAESTGKEGKGILPVVGEKVLAPEFYAPDRLFVYLKMKTDSSYDANIKELSKAGHPVLQIELNDPYDIGREYFRWELATAVAGWRMKINPFDQPNVEAAKKQAKKMMNEYQEKGKLPETDPVLKESDLEVFAHFSENSLSELLKHFLNSADSGTNNSKGRSYISFQAYMKPDPAIENALQKLRTDIQRKMKMATTFGYGPRFLHSTGQLHKGDAGNGLYVQFSADMPRDAKIPDSAGAETSSISFAVLKTAQHLGDRQALEDEGRTVIRIHLGSNLIDNLNKISRALP